jgi:thymidine phosphorylase
MSPGAQVQADGHAGAAPLKVRRIGLYTHDEPVVLMRSDCHVCRSEGLSPRSQVLLTANGSAVIATLYQVDGPMLEPMEAGLSEAAWLRLGLKEGDHIHVRHPPALPSLADVRRRIYGARLDQPAFTGIVNDIVAGRYTEVHTSAFLTACSAYPMDVQEITYLTRAMVEAGDRLAWDAPLTIDKHSVGGLPGNRTTPIVVSVVAALGLVMPKTSSRAITSPAGTADTMETLAPVDLDLPTMRRVVETEGGCIAWGGAIRLSPADDILIRVERVLDVDAEGQLVASVLSKKLAAGSTHVVLDLPVGPTAKVRSEEAARLLSDRLAEVGAAFGLQTRCVLTDGSQPVGRGIGPALEALDVLAVLQAHPAAPQDLKRRACLLAGAALELAGAAPEGQGAGLARAAIDDGRAWAKFQRICEAQGGMRTPPVSTLRRPLTAAASGRLEHINNRKLARLAKLAGAPDAKSAGVEMHVRLGHNISAGQPLVTVHAEAPGELEYALEYAAANADMFEIEA